MKKLLYTYVFLGCVYMHVWVYVGKSFVSMERIVHVFILNVYMHVCVSMCFCVCKDCALRCVGSLVSHTYISMYVWVYMHVHVYVYHLFITQPP